MTGLHPFHILRLFGMCRIDQHLRCLRWDQFVSVGNAGGIFTSLDGLTWTAQVSGTTNNLNALVRTASGYTAVGAAGTVLTSF